LPLSEALRAVAENPNATGLNVDDLVLLRGTVESWVERAAEAVLEFRRDDGSFWKARLGGPCQLWLSLRTYER
jgi:hypothetical protein